MSVHDPLRGTTEFFRNLLEDAEILQASIKPGSVAQIVVAVIAVTALVYLLTDKEAGPSK